MLNIEILLLCTLNLWKSENIGIKIRNKVFTIKYKSVVPIQTDRGIQGRPISDWS